MLSNHFLLNRKEGSDVFRSWNPSRHSLQMAYKPEPDSITVVRSRTIASIRRPWTKHELISHSNGARLAFHQTWAQVRGGGRI